MTNHLSVQTPKFVAILVVIAVLTVAVSPDTAPAQGKVDSNMATYLVIRFEADEAKLAEFSAIMQGVETDMQTEPGFVSATVYQDVDDPGVFTLVELWQSRKAHEEHFDRIVASGAWQHILGLLREEPEMGYSARL